MISESFKEIRGMGDNIKRLVNEQYQTGKLRLLTLEKEERNITDVDIKKIKEVYQISPFFDAVKI